ncbi:MAG: DNA mismatch repair endonuclease MutL [Planctomycetes bacterium]|nr:DNA mismatch repair endonuclease MutL [Planctomycetota bacterium]
MTHERDLTGGSEPRIRVLPELVKNQIAAGEVIERPASVVKELVENALDAGATRLVLDLEEGGAKLVRLVDDGVGMGEADLRLAFHPHATSKLADAADLEHIATLGFRGEALASMGSVARCRLFSRPRGAALGAELENEGGKVSAVRSAGGAEGTRIEVRDLFYNTPARRRFLKTTATELARCLDVVQRLALAHVGVGFVVTHDGRRVFDVEAGMDLGARIRRIFGAELASGLVPVGELWQGIELRGYVAPPRFAARDTSRQVWCLNGRPVRDKLLVRVLKEAYRGYLIDARQPAAVLSLALDPARVDVNVHPAKSEVRFRDERALFGFLVAALRKAVAATDMATPGEGLLAVAERREAWSARFAPPSAGSAATTSFEFDRAGAIAERSPLRPAHERQAEFRDAAPFVPEPPLAPRPSFAAAAEPEPPLVIAAREVSARPGERRELDELAGPFLQIAKTYLVRATADGFEIVDQHALHERINFELLREAAATGRVALQRLLAPELVEITRAQAELVDEHREAFAKLGLELERFGPTTAAVHGVPARLAKPDVSALVRDVLALVEESGRAPDAPELFEEVLHRAACRASVMAGDPLSEDEIRELFARGRGLSSDQTCPHARPTRVRFTLADLEKAFHRR